MSNIDFVNRILDADRKAREAERDNPVARLSAIEQANARLAAENAKQYEALGLGKHKQSRETDRQLANVQRRQDAMQKLYEQAVEAFDSEDAWVDVPTTDEYGYEYEEQKNPKYEDAVSRILAFGQEAVPFVQALVEEHGEDTVAEVASMVAERNQLAQLAAAKEAETKRAADLLAKGTKLAARADDLMSARLNPMFDPQDPQLLGDIAHHQQQARATDIPEEKRHHVEAIKALQLEAGRRGMAREEALGIFAEMAANAPADIPYNEAERLLIASMQVAGNTYDQLQQADRVTARYQAQFDERGISADSRDRDGKLVIVDPDTGNTLAVTDDAAAVSLANGWVAARDYKALPDISEETVMAALNPQPTPEQRLADFAKLENERLAEGYHEKRAEEAMRAHAEEMNARDAEHAAEEARRTERNSGATYLKEMEARLGGNPDGSPSTPSRDPFDPTYSRPEPAGGSEEA